MNPQHGIVGDEFGTDIPETQVPDRDLTDELKRAKFSRTKEFKEQREYLEQRVAFYQNSLPDGRIVGVGQTPTGEDWLVANAIISEINAFLDRYVQAEEAVKKVKA